MSKWLKNIKIRAKLTFGFSIVIILGLIIGLLGISSILKLSGTERNLYNNNVMGEQYVSDALESLLIIRVNVRDLYIYADSDKAEYYDSIDSSFSDIYNDMDKLSGILTTDNIKTQLDGYKALADNIVKESKSGVKGKELLDTIASGKTAGNDIQSAFKDLSKSMSDDANSQIANDKKSADMLILLLGAIISLSLIIALIMVFSISNMIAKPLGKIAQFSSMLAIGDLNVEKIIDEKDREIKNRKDEIGMLALSFNHLIASTKEQAINIESVSDGDLTVAFNKRSADDLMGKSLSDVTKKLNKLIKEIVASSEQVASSSRMLSESSVTLSQSAASQASSVEELTASISEITDQSLRTSDRAQKANELAQAMRNSAAFEVGQMQEMVKAMDRISACANGVNGIIKVIDDIAFQTNILALNAAVEAARVGQVGKGFAVVAEEIRALATKSSKAVLESTELIINSIDSVKVGSTIAANTKNSLEKILNDISNTADLIDSISADVREQTASIEQINQGVGLISNSVQTTSATSEENAAASEELSSQAAILLESVKSFKTKK